MYLFIELRVKDDTQSPSGPFKTTNRENWDSPNITDTLELELELPRFHVRFKGS